MESTILKAISIDNLPSDSIMLKIVIVFVWLFTFLTLGFVLIFYRDYVTLKLQGEEFVLKKTNMKQIELRTAMVFGVPLHLQNEVLLADFFDKLCIGKVDSVVVCRTWYKLQNALHQRAKYLDKLEEIAYNLRNRIVSVPSRDLFPAGSSVPEYRHLFSGLHSSLRPKHRLGVLKTGKQVDSIEYYLEKFSHYDELCSELRRNPESSASTGVAFVTFESPVSAVLHVNAGVSLSDCASLGPFYYDC
jgi:hypothetical protein